MPRKTEESDDWFYCPNCGGHVKVGAKACRGCGSDDNTGWKEDTADGLDLEEDFDYEEFARREFGGEEKGKVNGLRWYWWVTALLILTVLAAGLVLTYGNLLRR